MEEITSTEQKKRPVFLVVLVVLSMISIVIGFFSAILNMLSGPMTEEMLETYTANQYESIAVMRDLNSEGLANIIEQILQMTIYQNNEAFFSFHFLSLITVVVGFVGVMMMFRLQKLGFHLYIIYSLLPILILYILIPMNMIPSFVVIGSLLLSAVFVILYALNLKHMR